MYGSSSSLSAHRRFDLNLQKLQSHRIASHFVAFALRLPPPPARGDEGKKKESSIPWKYIWLISSSMTKMQLHWQRNWHVPAMEGWRKETVSPPWSLKETASFPWLKKERTYGFSLWSLKKRMWFFIWSRSKKQLYRFSRGSRAQGSRFLLFRNFLFVKSRVWGSCRGEFFLFAEASAFAAPLSGHGRGNLWNATRNWLRTSSRLDYLAFLF